MKKLTLLAALIAALFALSCEQVAPDRIDGDNNVEQNNGDDQQETDNGDNPGKEDDGGQGKEDDVIVDWAPIVLGVYISDAEGNNLLDPAFEGAYNIDDMVLTYEGEEYEVVSYLAPKEPTVRPLAYLAIFDGAHVICDRDGAAVMVIGEWARDDKWDMATVEVAWGDGTKDTFAFSHDYTYDPEYRNDAEHSWGYTFTSQFYLNGEPNADCVYRLVK